MGDAFVTRIGDTTTKVPLIFIPGVTGSYLYDGINEVWPNMLQLALSGPDDFLQVLRLKPNGIDPYDPSYDIEVGDILRDPFLT